MINKGQLCHVGCKQQIKQFDSVNGWNGKNNGQNVKRNGGKYICD